MDSGNSGSQQSSSGGGDDFDSRRGADSSPLSELLRHPPSPSVPGFGGGSLIYGLRDLSTPPQSHWSSTTPLPAGAGPSPPSLLRHDGLAVSAGDQQATAAPAQAAAAAGPPRGSRKRARASRRAPTTVLTTDTSNFRAMVQEFTGIPAPPFAGASSARSRFDHLFPARSAAGAGSPATLPEYMLRPFAHKLHASTGPYPTPFTLPSSSSPASANVPIASASSAAPGTTAVPPGSDYQLTTASPSALLGVQDHHSSSSNYVSFLGTHGAQLNDGDAKYATAQPVFDRRIAPSSSAPRMQDPAHFLGLPYGRILGSEVTTHAHLHPRSGGSDRGRGGEELSGLVGGASVTVAGGCKATSNYTTPPLLERNGCSPSAGVSAATTTTPVATTAGMRTQGLDSWVCTSD